MKVSDIIAEFIVNKAIDKVFWLTGGGIMHLTDSVSKRSEIEYICNFHEQACAIAAEGYARVTGKPGVCFGTTGPGIANILSGAIGAWHDSIPLLIFCGQVRSATRADYSKIRQLGPQEGNITAMAHPMTKYVVSISDPKMILFELEKSYWYATTGRPGPVLIEVPLDIQAAEVNKVDLTHFQIPIIENVSDKQTVIKILQTIRDASYPILFPGNGIRLGGAFDLWIEFYNLCSIPAVLPYTAIDLLYEEHDYNMGVIGTLGQRRANFAVQNSDCFVSLASGINITKIGFNIDGFAPKAKKIIVDIDNGQIYNQPIKPYIGLQINIKEFLRIAIAELKVNPIKPNVKWLDACQYWKQKYPIVLNEFFDDKKHVNMYVFHDKLSDLCVGDSTVVTGNGMEAQSLFQSFKVKKNQRILIPGNWGAMGWDLPTAVGAAKADVDKNIILITGDGSIMLNVQELLTCSANNIPIKIFIFNNNGYALIRSTQNNLLNKNLVGSDYDTGVQNPHFDALAKAFNFEYALISNNNEVEKMIKEVLTSGKSTICEVNISYDVIVVPKAIALKKADGTMESKPLEDMFPFLPAEEIMYNMNILNN